MTLEAFIADLEELLEDLEPGTLSADTVYKDLAVWDSLAVLQVINMADAELGVSLRAEDLRECRTIGELHGLVEARRAG